MSCINPIPIYAKPFSRFGFKFINNTSNTNYVNCGRCLNCLISRESQLSFLLQKEVLEAYKKKLGCSFVTLTYDEENIPLTEDGFYTLDYNDVRKFIKNVRRQIEYYNLPLKFKTCYCGELGTDRGRPHYHIIFIGLSDVEVSAFTRKLWNKGICQVGPLGAGGIRYVCKYITKQYSDLKVRAFRKKHGIAEPKVFHSIGIGKDWINRNMQKIADDSFLFEINGKIQMYPIYIIKYVSAHLQIDYKPIVRDYFINRLKVLSSVKNKSIEDLTYEQAYLTYKNKVAGLRSRGIPVNDITLSKKYIKPLSALDRSYIYNLASNSLGIYYTDSIPF